MDRDEQQAWISYAAGLSHGALMVVKELLLSRDYERATRTAHMATEMVERIIFRGEESRDSKGTKRG